LIHWLQLHLTVDKSQAALIEHLLETLGAVAVSLGDAGDEPMLEPGPGETPLWQATRITGLFDGNTDADALRSRIEQALTAHIGRSLRLERLAERDWERVWLDQFKPMRFGRRLWIRPSGSTIEADDAVVVDLDPGLAFGTGTHPTTALCLTWLDGSDVRGKRVIDFGCGSGVLAIAALRLGAAHAVAIDHDPQALIATTDNAARNGVRDRLTVVGSEEVPGDRAAVVVANILANVLVDLAPTISSLVEPGGQLVLSGILADQADDVMQAYAGSVKFAPRIERDGWVLLHGTAQ
jgi:ribosomal protein L11 methyltransferase